MYSVVTTAEHEDGSTAYQVREQRDRTGLTVLVLTGEFDHYANAVVDGVVGRVWGGAAGDVLVDLCGVTFLNGHGLAAMLHLQRAARVRSRRLILRCEAGTVARLLGLVGLADLVQETSPSPAPSLRLVHGGDAGPGDRPRRRRRSMSQASRQWHHGDE